VRCDFTPKTAVLRFWALFRGLRGNVRWSSKANWKARSVKCTFFARCYGWGATGEYRFEIGDFAPTWAGWPKISGRRGRPINHSSSQKTRLNDLLYGVKIWTDLTSVLSQSTPLTDGHLSQRWHSMQRGKKRIRKLTQKKPKPQFSVWSGSAKEKCVARVTIIKTMIWCVK